MPSPDYLICLNCETPCYTFEFENGEVTEILCQMCGNDETDQFAEPDDFDAMSEGHKV